VVRDRTPPDGAGQVHAQQSGHAGRRERHRTRHRQAYVPEAPVKRWPERVQRAHHVPAVAHHAQNLGDQRARISAAPGLRKGRHPGHPGHLVHGTADVLPHRNRRRIRDGNTVQLRDQRDVLLVVPLVAPKPVQHALRSGRRLEPVRLDRHADQATLVVRADLPYLHAIIASGHATELNQIRLRTSVATPSVGAPGAGSAGPVSLPDPDSSH